MFFGGYNFNQCVCPSSEQNVGSFMPQTDTPTGSKEFQSSYLSACHFALVLQLDKEENPLSLTKFFLVRMSGQVDSLDSVL